MRALFEEIERSDATRELTLFFNEVGNELMAFFAYNADLFDPPTVAGFADKFARIADLKIGWLPYGELSRHREAISRFGEGLKAIRAIARPLP